MKIALSLMTKLMRRAGNNPFASAKTRARNLLLRLQEEGYSVVRDPLLNLQADLVKDLPVNTTLEPTPDPVSRPVTLTRKERARLHFNNQDWVALYDLKKSSKVYWDRLGFNQPQIIVIQANEPK